MLLSPAHGSYRAVTPLLLGNDAAGKRSQPCRATSDEERLIASDEERLIAEECNVQLLRLF